ncbi:carbon storage regulator [Planctellipticum variicoloris]|uniref:carbon storage regulator n=1 Tax=Planctellipticum variicoloris TaxID=3064265 RepID=UPI002D0E68E7|nr:carbon storage regulator [Planctomycetaceae bacterium SH412]HTN02648.1 carbon storage regulator [Planctomycetaceae bacterium]
MLVLTRKINERIVIGDGIEVVVLSVRGNRVTLGIAAPLETSIRRVPTTTLKAPAPRRELELAGSVN